MYPVSVETALPDLVVFGVIGRKGTIGCEDKGLWAASAGLPGLHDYNFTNEWGKGDGAK